MANIQSAKKRARQTVKKNELKSSQRAFEVFEKKGLFHKSSGKKLKELVYSSGNSKNLMDQFIKFNGKKPDPKRLLQKRGLT